MPEELMREHFERWFKKKYPLILHLLEKNTNGEYFNANTIDVFTGFKAGVELASKWQSNEVAYIEPLN